MIEPYETEKQCRTCLVCKPVAQFYAGRAVCRPCRDRAAVVRRKELRAGAAKRNACETDFRGLPVHEYTETDRAWQTTHVPAINRGLLTWRFA